MRMKQSKTTRIEKPAKIKTATPRDRKKPVIVKRNKALGELSARCGISAKSFEVVVAAARRLPLEIAGCVSRWIDALADLEADDRRECATSISAALETLIEKREDPLASVDEPMGFSEALRVTIQAEREISASRNLILGDSLSAEDAAAASGRSRQNLEALRRSNRVVALRVGHRWRYPAWQFDPDGVGGVLNGIRDVIAGLRLSPAGTALWLIQPSPMLKGERPIDRLRKGQVDEVVRIAEESGRAA